jgi:hypothetical protein
MTAYHQEHSRLTLDPEGRSHKHTYVTVDEARGQWQVAQVLVDPEGLNDWQASFLIDKATAREQGRPVLQLLSVAAIGA